MKFFLLVFFSLYTLSIQSKPLLEEKLVGRTKVSLPAPEGYVSLESSAPKAYQDLLIHLPNELQVLAVFVPLHYVADFLSGNRDLPNHYLLAGYVKGYESRSLTNQQFAELRANTRDRVLNNTKEIKAVNDYLRNIESNITHNHGVDVNIEIENNITIGLSHDLAKSIGYVNLLTSVLKVDNESIRTVELVSTSMINTGKLIFLKIFQPYQESKDIEFIEELSKEWSLSTDYANDMFENGSWKKEIQKLKK